MHTQDGSRRKFLKGAGITAGAAAMAAFMPRIHAAGDDTIRVALIGCGGRGTGAADQTLSVPNSKVELVAVCDAFENRIEGALKELSKKHGDKVKVGNDKKFVGLDGYLKAIESADLVILATPPGFRPQHFDAAVNAGKNVFMEKPVCVDSFGARMVLAAAKRADEKNLKVVCGLQRHYQAVYREAFKRVQEGLIGDIISGNIYWNGNGIWFRDRQDGMSEMKYQVHNWYHFNWLCGDHICEQHVHNIDVANWFLGGHPISAEGMGGRTDMSRNSEIFDHHAVEFRYPNGVVINSQCRQIAGTKSDVREEFHGTKGILYLESGHAVDYKGKTIWKNEVKGLNPYQVEHNELHDFIRKDAKVNNAYYTCESTFAAVLGRTATYSGVEQKWDDLLKANFHTFPDAPNFETATPTKPGANGRYAVPVPGQYKIG